MIIFIILKLYKFDRKIIKNLGFLSISFFKNIRDLSHLTEHQMNFLFQEFYWQRFFQKHEWTFARLFYDSCCEQFSCQSNYLWKVSYIMVSILKLSQFWFIITKDNCYRWCNKGSKFVKAPLGPHFCHPCLEVEYDFMKFWEDLIKTLINKDFIFYSSV